MWFIRENELLCPGKWMWKIYASRMQIEKLLLAFQPTMLFVEHDVRFCEKIATRIIEL